MNIQYKTEMQSYFLPDKIAAVTQYPAKKQKQLFGDKLLWKNCPASGGEYYLVYAEPTTTPIGK